MRLFRRKRRGQAAVETMYTIPVMLLVYLIGSQLWAITWNAQYAHVKARKNLFDTASHKPCSSNTGNQLMNAEGTASATTRGSNYYGGRFLPTSQDRTLQARYKITCG